MKPLEEMTLDERVKLYAEGDSENGIHLKAIFRLNFENEEAERALKLRECENNA